MKMMFFHLSHFRTKIINCRKNTNHIPNSTRSASFKWTGLVFFLDKVRRKKLQTCLLIWIKSLLHKLGILALTAISLFLLNTSELIFCWLKNNNKTEQVNRKGQENPFFQPLTKMKFRASHFWHLMKGVHFKLPRWQWQNTKDYEMLLFGIITSEQGIADILVLYITFFVIKGKTSLMHFSDI